MHTVVHKHSYVLVESEVGQQGWETEKTATFHC